MISFIKSTIGKMIVSIIIISVLLIYITFNWIIELSSFAVGMAKATLGIIIFYLFDKVAMKEIDTVQELKNGNVAYAIFMLSLAILVMAAMLGS